MARKVNVPVHGSGSKVARVEHGATVGARIGADLLMPGGEVATIQAIAQALGPLLSADAPEDVNPVAHTLWGLVSEKPPNIIAVAALSSAGLVTRLSDGTWVTRAIDVADTSRLTIADGVGAAGNPTLDMADVPAVSVWARAAITAGKPAALEAAANDTVLRRVGDALDFGALTAGMFPATVVPDAALSGNVMLKDAPENTLTGDLIVQGNLTVSGDVTVVNTTELQVGDNIITLNADETGAPSQNAGIEIERGTSANVAVRWNEASDRWELTEDGATYYPIRHAGNEGAIVIDWSQLTSVPATFPPEAHVHAGGDITTDLDVLTAALNPFTSVLQGVAPASGGGTVNYLRADGTWAEPPGSGGGGPAVSSGTISLDLMGVDTSPLSGDFDYYVVGRLCTLTRANGLSGTSTSTSMSLETLPGFLTPPTTRTFIYTRVTNGTINGVARVMVLNTGVIHFSSMNSGSGAGPISGGAFPTSGTKGLSTGFQLQYLI